MYIRLNKYSFLREQGMIILIVISMVIQYFYMLGYADQGMLYQLIAPMEKCIYMFNAFICIYGFWRIAGKSKTRDVIVSIIAAVTYSIHFIAYHTVIRICATESAPETTEKLAILILDKVKEEFTTSSVKYIVASVLIFATCLFVAIVTPSKIRHEFHVLKISYYKHKDYTSRELKTLNEDILITQYDGKTIVLPNNIENGSCGESKYQLYFEAINRDTGSTYLVFSDYEINDNDRFVFYVAKYNRAKKLLSPVNCQEDFDKIENCLICPPF